MDHWTISLMMACTLAAFAATSAVYSQQPVLMSEVDIAALDIAGHHFDIDSPSDEMTACYYCINVSSNEMCNRFAIETPCSTADDYSSDMTVCYTFHVMDERGKTVTVTKQCATTETCSSQVGCRPDKATNQTVCVSCCDLNYCNVEVAFNASDAVFQRSNDETAAFSSATRSADGARWALMHQSLIFFLLAFLSSSI
ncbi:ly6/PLAUR domain-containing protein 6B-like [Daphnia pulex]|uniref:ly6/PLAUR domain-containing protein 6B-like n=1 Tax=Daphnia pulex TaxID=6669 RepID=UPI001EDE1256|nr:ly6/PLAUR domain-containing protein 6B-like [Daphnia pulex]